MCILTSPYFISVSQCVTEFAINYTIVMTGPLGADHRKSNYRISWNKISVDVLTYVKIAPNHTQWLYINSKYIWVILSVCHWALYIWRAYTLLSRLYDGWPVHHLMMIQLWLLITLWNNKYICVALDSNVEFFRIHIHQKLSVITIMFCENEFAAE